MRIKHGAQAVPGGALIASQNNIVSLYLHEGDALLDSGIDTDAEGFWEYTWVPTGSAATSWVLKPGPVYWTLTYLGKVHRGSSKAGGLVGLNSMLELPELIISYGDYVVFGAVTGDFAVTYDGAGLDVDIAAGYAVVRGVGVKNPASRKLNFAAAHATLPRIDTVVLELDRVAGDTEGKVTLKVVTGTANASPVAPTLTQTASTWQYALADVRINAASANVTSVTDRRTTPVTAVTRNPTLMPVLRTSPGATALTTTPTSVAALAHSITLVSGATYDIMIEASAEVSAPSPAFANMACFINGTSNAGTSISLQSTAIETLENAFSGTVLGTGAAISCGVLLSETGGDAVFYSGVSSVIAIPRS